MPTDSSYPARAGSGSIIPGVRRAWMSIMLAIVLSAIELDRRGGYHEPPAIVHLLENPPVPRRRGRPYRAHYRYTSVTSRNIGNPSRGL